jgi:hypothetical protein
VVRGSEEEGRCRRHPSPAGHGGRRTTSYGLWNLAWLARPAELAFHHGGWIGALPFSTRRPTRSPPRSAVERVELPLAPQSMGFRALRVLDHPHPPLTSSEWRVRVVDPTPGQVFQGCGASGCPRVMRGVGEGARTGLRGRWPGQGALPVDGRPDRESGAALRTARVPPAEPSCVYATVTRV